MDFGVGKTFAWTWVGTFNHWTPHMNPFQENPTVYLNLTNMDPKKLLLFSGIFREATGRTLEEFKKVHEQLKNSPQPRLAFGDGEGARRLGQQLLDFQVFEKVEVAEIGKTTEILKRTPPPPFYLCPQCQEKLGGSNECSHCKWQRFPSNPDRWEKAGNCPICQFSYRWDGQSCSHCGHGAIEQQRIRIIPEV